MLPLTRRKPNSMLNYSMNLRGIKIAYLQIKSSSSTSQLRKPFNSTYQVILQCYPASPAVPGSVDIHTFMYSYVFTFK